MPDGPAGADAAPRDEEELEERLSRPRPGVTGALASVPGDILVLGAGGKMGPSLAAMARRTVRALGEDRRVIAVSRWSDPVARDRLAAMGVEVLAADLGDRAALAALPDAPNVVYMAGQKFGTTDDPARTWHMNAVVPAMVAERFAASRVVAFSTGNVYPLVRADSPGAREDHALTPVGEYANSCVARERVLEHVARTRGMPLALVRLSYAVDLRYGVLVDIASRVLAGEPVPLAMGWANVIWQGDANAQALHCLALAAAPAPFVANVTGPERLSVREAATWLGERLGRAPVFAGTEGPDALLSDTTRARSHFGEPEVDARTLLAWVADWAARGGRRLGKPTHFEVRDGRY
jgi:nucleoside-diphosphate-sugar epimerase